MRLSLVMLILLPVVTWAGWQLQVEKPLLSPLTVGLLLLLLGLILGIRLATDSATRFVSDLVSVNKSLADQNRDLADLNHAYLKELAADSEPDAPLAPSHEHEAKPNSAT